MEEYKEGGNLLQRPRTVHMGGANVSIYYHPKGVVVAWQQKDLTIFETVVEGRFYRHSATGHITQHGIALRCAKFLGELLEADAPEPEPV